MCLDACKCRIIDIMELRTLHFGWGQMHTRDAPYGTELTLLVGF